MTEISDRTLEILEERKRQVATHWRSTPEMCRARRIFELIPMNKWLAMTEIRLFVEPHGFSRKEIGLSVNEMLQRGHLEVRPITPAKLEVVKQMVGQFTHTANMFRRTRREYDHGKFGSRAAHFTKLTLPQRIYISRNPDGLTARQLFPFFGCVMATIYGLMNYAAGERYKQPPYTEISDDELRALAFPDGAETIEMARRVTRKKKPVRNRKIKDIADEAHRWDVTKFG